MNSYTTNTLIQLNFGVATNAVPPVPVDPSVISAKVEAPDGTVTDLSSQIVRDDVGQYHVTFLTTETGLYQYECICTGNVQVAGKNQFLVTEATF